MTSVEDGNTLAKRILASEKRRDNRAFFLAVILLIGIAGLYFGLILLNQVFGIVVWQISLVSTCSIPSISLCYWSFYYLTRKMGKKGQIPWLGLSIIMTLFIGVFLNIFSNYTIFLMIVLFSYILLLISAIILVGIRALPGGKFAIWSLATLDIFAIGLELIEFNTLFPFPNITIEIMGAFVGFAGAVALTELLKSFEERSASNKLFDTLVEELIEVETHLKNKVGNPVEIPYWTAAVADGAILSIESGKRKRVKDAYISIERYNSQKTPENASIARKTIISVIG